MKKEEINHKILQIMDSKISSIEKKIFKNLIFDCDLHIKNRFEHTPVSYVLTYNNIYHLQFDEKEIQLLLEMCDINQKISINNTIIFTVLENYKNKNFQFSSEYMMKLLDKSDFNVFNKQGNTLFARLWETVNYEKMFFLEKEKMMEYFYQCSPKNQLETFIYIYRKANNPSFNYFQEAIKDLKDYCPELVKEFEKYKNQYIDQNSIIYKNLINFITKIDFKKELQKKLLKERKIETKQLKL